MNPKTLLTLAALVLIPAALFATSKEWSKGQDNFYSYDGVFYSFFNTDGQGIKLWVPPGQDPIRGMILHGNPGGGHGGDTRDKTRQRDILEFAARHHFGVAGVTGFPGVEVYDKLAPVLFETFSAWAELGVHPELQHIPVICTGGSNAGMFSYGVMCHSPERVIAITPNCGPRYNGVITRSVLKVPAWMHIGAVDPLLPRGVEVTEQLFANHVPDMGYWAWDAEIKGHENGSTDHVDYAYWDAIIPLRLPPNVPRGDPVLLRELDWDQGWWVDHRSWDYVITTVAPATEPRPNLSERGRYGWVPNEDIARTYQSIASRQRLMSIEFVASERNEGGNRSGVLLSSGGSVMASGGDRVRIKLSLAPMVWEVAEVSFFDQAEAIGTLKLSESDTFEFTVDGNKRVYSIHARSENRGGPVISNPLQVVVRDPHLSADIDKQLASTAFETRFRERALSGRELDRLKGSISNLDTLPQGAVGSILLTPEQEKAIKEDGAVSSIWDELRRLIAPVSINGTPMQEVSSGQAMAVSSAYGQKGLYLLFTAKDDSWTAPELDDFDGTIDFHLASIGLPRLLDSSPTPEFYAYPQAYSILRSAVQIQIPISGNLDADQRFFMNYWNPFDPVRLETAQSQGYLGLGLFMDRAESDDGRRHLELFLPWSLVGHPGISTQPPAGSSFAANFRYHAVPEAETLCWPTDVQPWGRPAKDPETGQAMPNIYGQIVLLENTL